MYFEEAEKIAKSGQIHDQSDEKLNEMLQACMAVYSGNPAILMAVQNVSTLVRDEISRREAFRRHQEGIAENSKLKIAVDGLKNPHKLHWWLLVVAILTAIFAGISAWPVIQEWFRGW